MLLSSSTSKSLRPQKTKRTQGMQRIPPFGRRRSTRRLSGKCTIRQPSLSKAWSTSRSWEVCQQSPILCQVARAVTGHAGFQTLTHVCLCRASISAIRVYVGHIKRLQVPKPRYGSYCLPLCTACHVQHIAVLLVCSNMYSMMRIAAAKPREVCLHVPRGSYKEYLAARGWSGTPRHAGLPHARARICCQCMHGMWLLAEDTRRQAQTGTCSCLSCMGDMCIASMQLVPLGKCRRERLQSLMATCSMWL